MTWQEKKAELQQFDQQHRPCGSDRQFMSRDGGDVTLYCNVCNVARSHTFDVVESPVWVMQSMLRDAVVLVIGAATEDEARLRAQEVAPGHF